MSQLIKSISFSQDDILKNISRLYLKGEPFEVDPTYSKGVFYKSGVVKQPKFRFDINPQKNTDATFGDCRNLPFKDGTVRSLIIDLPFLATTGKSLKKEDDSNLMGKRFGVYPNETELYKLYELTIIEAFRTLSPKGILVMKCQDKVSSGKQYMLHCSVFYYAMGAGFIVEDLFVLLAKSRMVADWQRNQKHARKFHSYFWVFRKPR